MRHTTLNAGLFGAASLITEDAGQRIAAQCFARRLPIAPDLRAGTNITLTRMAGFIQLDAAGGAADGDQAVLAAGRIFAPRPLRPAPPADDTAPLLAGKVFGVHPPATPDLRAGTNITLTRMAGFVQIDATASASAGDGDQTVLPAGRIFAPRPTPPAPPADDTAPLLAGKVFGVHPPATPDLRAGTNITLTRMAGFVQIDATGGTSAGDGDQTVLPAGRIFAPRPTPPAAPADDTAPLLAGKVFAAHPPAPIDLRAGTNITLTRMAGFVQISAAGGGGASATTVETNLGATARFAGRFTLTDAAITGTSKVLCWQAPGAYTGKGTRADEAEMQPVSVIAVAPSAGTAQVYWQTPPMVVLSPTPQMQQGTVTTIPKDPQAVTAGVALRKGLVRGNVKFSYMVLS